MGQLVYDILIGFDAHIILHKHCFGVVFYKISNFIINRLAEVGKLSVPKVHEKYETGQFFLHRVFGYRGVILFPWRAKVYDRNAYIAPAGDETAGIDVDTTLAAKIEKPDEKIVKNVESSPNENADMINERLNNKKEVVVKIQTYYQVLVDSRDCPHVVSTLLQLSIVEIFI